MVIDHSGIGVELREVLLSDKPKAMLAASAKGTVPVLVLPDGTVLDESLDIIKWALDQGTHNSNTLNLSVFAQDSEAGKSLIEINDGKFKRALDGYKYGQGFPEKSQQQHRSEGELFLQQLETLLESHQFLLSDQMSLVDIAIFPFIRQFAFVDKNWFDQSGYPLLQYWLQHFLDSELFLQVMTKYPVWDESKETQNLINH
ncbi:MAG: glutathione S-transferase [Flavobacteriaceae bacterium]|jgi:glutathione S-transferase